MLPKSDTDASARSMEADKQPPPLSQRTVAVMIQLFETLTQSGGRSWAFLDPLLDEKQIHDTLFAMNFEKRFLDKCDDTYHWNFRYLLPALIDCSFFTDSPIQRPFHVSSGQAYLRGFATLLSGMYWHRKDLEPFHDQHAALASALEADGWLFDGNHLVELRKATIDEPKEVSLVEQLVRSSNHDRKDIVLHHFGNGQRLYDEGKYHPCSGEWRAFLEELLRGIWRQTRLRRKEFETFAEIPPMSDIFKFLRRQGSSMLTKNSHFEAALGFYPWAAIQELVRKTTPIYRKFLL